MSPQSQDVKIHLIGFIGHWSLVEVKKASSSRGLLGRTSSTAAEIDVALFVGIIFDIFNDSYLHHLPAFSD